MKNGGWTKGLVWGFSFLALTGFWGSIQVAHAQGRAYTANFGSDNLSVIDTSSNTLVATVPLGTQPNSVALTPDGSRAYVTNGGGDVWVLSTSTKIVVGGYPSGIASIGTLIGLRFIGRSVAAPTGTGMGVLLAYVGLVPLQELLPRGPIAWESAGT